MCCIYLLEILPLQMATSAAAATHRRRRRRCGGDDGGGSANQNQIPVYDQYQSILGVPEVCILTRIIQEIGSVCHAARRLRRPTAPVAAASQQPQAVAVRSTPRQIVFGHHEGSPLSRFDLTLLLKNQSA